MTSSTSVSISLVSLTCISILSAIYTLGFLSVGDYMNDYTLNINET